MVRKFKVFVAYINLKSVLQEKAQTMIMNDAIITGSYSKIVLVVDKPYLEIKIGT
jgi:hypothetical protein